MTRHIRSAYASLVILTGALLLLPAGIATALSVTSYSLISATASGVPGNQQSDTLTMTPNGRYVAFASYATNLTSDAIPSGPAEAYLYDRQAGTMEIVSRTDNGDLANQGARPYAISDDGRYILLTSNSTNFPGGTQGVFLRDRQAGTTTRLGDVASFHAMSADANIFVLSSLNSSGALNGNYVYNRATGQTIPLPSNAQGLSVSADGQYVGYTIYDTTATGYRYNVATGETTNLGTNVNDMALSPDGSHALFYGINPTTQNYDVFYQDIASGQRQTLFQDSHSSAFGSLQFDRAGRRVSYLAGVNSSSSFTADEAVVTDVTTSQTVVVDNGLHHRGFLSLSDDGSQLAFSSATRATGSPDNQQVYVATLAGDTTPPVVTGTPDRPANANGWYNNDVTITWNATDDSGIATQPPATTASAEGTNTPYTSTQSCDASGNCATGNLALSIDKTAPTVSGLQRSPFVIRFTGNMSINANASDSLSGVKNGEYYIDTDPGQGNGSPMTYDSSTGKISGTKTFVNGALSPGMHTLYVRSQDAAGNWSTVTSATFIYI